MKKKIGGRNHVTKTPRPKSDERLTIPQTKKVIRLALKFWGTKAEVGRRIGYSYQMVTRYEKGESRLPIKFVQKLQVVIPEVSYGKHKR